MVHKLKLYVVTTNDNKVGFFMVREKTTEQGYVIATQAFGADNVAKVETPPANYNLLEGEEKPKVAP